MSKTVIRELVTGYVENLKDKARLIIQNLYDCTDGEKCEKTAYNMLLELLKADGFEVIENVSGIANSFIAKFGNSSPTIAYICEYDAVDGLGYINGHNIQCSINLLGAIGLKRAVSEIGGTVVVYGCPSEEKKQQKYKCTTTTYLIT